MWVLWDGFRVGVEDAWYCAGAVGRVRTCGQRFSVDITEWVIGCWRKFIMHGCRGNEGRGCGSEEVNAGGEGRARELVLKENNSFPQECLACVITKNILYDE